MEKNWFLFFDVNLSLNSYCAQHFSAPKIKFMFYGGCIQRAVAASMWNWPWQQLKCKRPKTFSQTLKHFEYNLWKIGHSWKQFIKIFHGEKLARKFLFRCEIVISWEITFLWENVWPQVNNSLSFCCKKFRWSQ